MSDLLSKVIRCDLCGERKEQRYFGIVADEDNFLSVCKDCEDFMIKEDEIFENEKKFLQQITIDDVITEIKRELKVRERVYPDWVASGKIRQSCADFRKRCLQANLIFLEEIAKQTREQQSLF